MLHIPSVAYINYLNINEHDYEDIQPLITKTVPSTRRVLTTGHMAIRYATIQYNTINVLVPSLQNMADCALQCQ